MPLDAQKLRDFLAGLGVASHPLEDTTPLFSSGAIDSFSLVDLMVFIENEGGFRMNPSEVSLDNLDTIERILAFVRTKAS